MSHLDTINRYGAIASEIYDIDKPVDRLADTAFYLDRLGSASLDVLEPACGSGRALIPLAKAGHRMTGYDASPEMLARAEARCREAGVNAALSRATFENFEPVQRYEALVLPVGSFTLIREARTAHIVLRRFHEALTSGGRLILDVNPLSALAETRDDRREWIAPNGDVLTLEGIRTGTHWIDQTATRTYRYERWRDGALIAAERDVMVQRHWGFEEMRLALDAAGFAQVSCVGDYGQRGAIGQATRVLTWEATRI